jgi:hypothetical protein
MIQERRKSDIRKVILIVYRALTGGGKIDTLYRPFYGRVGSSQSQWLYEHKDFGLSRLRSLMRRDSQVEDSGLRNNVCFSNCEIGFWAEDRDFNSKPGCEKAPLRVSRGDRRRHQIMQAIFVDVFRILLLYVSGLQNYLQLTIVYHHVLYHYQGRRVGSPM